MTSPKLKKDDLFLLIKSMSKAEKRHFKLFSQLQKGDKVYLTLFDEVDAQEKYDEEIIKKKLANKKFTANIHVAKKYLYDTLIKVLRSYEGSNSIAAELLALLSNISLLHERSLNEQAKLQLHKFYQIAEKYEKFEYLILATQLHKRILWAQKSNGYNYPPYVQVTNSQNEFLDKFVNKLQYHEISLRLQEIHEKQPYIRNKKDETAYKEILKNPLLQDENKAISNQSKWRMYSSLAESYRSLGYQELSNKYEIKQMEVFQKNESLIEENLILFLENLSRLPYSFALINRKKETYENIESFKNTFKKYEGQLTPYQSITIKVLGFHVELLCYNIFKDFTTCLKRTKEIQPFIEKNKSNTHAYLLAFIYWDFAYLSLYMKDFKNALRYTNEILALKDLDVFNVVIESYTRIMQLLLHAELKNDIILPYIIRSTYRFLSARKELYQTEKAILSFTGKLMKKRTSSNQDVTDNYKQLYDSIVHLKNDPYEKSFFYIFDLVYWLEQRIKG